MKKNRGQTLIAILVAVLVGSLLLIGIFSLLSDFFKSRQRSQRLSQLAVTGNNILSDINQEIHWSYDAILGSQELTLLQNEEGVEVTVTYSLSGDELLKDGVPISPEEVKITAFEIHNRAPTTPPLLQFHLGLEHVVQKPKISLEKDTTISIRKLRFGGP